VTIFGVPWADIDADHVRTFLDAAGAEPLLWEAKGTELDKHEIRRQVCGFANSHEGGYLILGARQTPDGWELDGVDFPDEPPTWISSIVGEGAVRPYPDGLDTKPLDLGNGAQAAVVRIPPTSSPPCNTFVAVYERVSGRTIPVREPLRLATLFARGEQAHQVALAKAATAAQDAIDRGRSHPAHGDEHVQFGFGLSAVGYEADISSRLFTPEFDNGALTSIRTRLERRAIGSSEGPSIMWEVSQIARTLETTATHPLGYSWSVEAGWAGAISVYWTLAVTQLNIDSVVDGPLKQAWVAAEEILKLLAPRGGRYLHIQLAGGTLPPNRRDEPQWGGRRPALPVVSQGPLDAGTDDTVLASIARELHRATGEMVYEPVD
jgi:hypothetical protein